MIICLMCGTANTDSNHCTKCGARLPKLDTRTAGGVATARQTGKYEKLREAVMKVKTGEHSWHQFEEWYQVFFDDINGKIQFLLDSINQSHGPGWNYYEEFTEEVETTFSGIEDYKLALEQVWHAIEGGDLVLAQSAVKLFLRGAEKLNDACVLNAETQRKLEEGWGYM
ncbi:hypothetical protein IV102_00275 [bacterium]|nr:hypothetical protein [bacterium]